MTGRWVGNVGGGGTDGVGGKDGVPAPGGRKWLVGLRPGDDEEGRAPALGLTLGLPGPILGLPQEAPKRGKDRVPLSQDPGPHGAQPLLSCLRELPACCG